MNQILVTLDHHFFVVSAASNRSDMLRPHADTEHPSVTIDSCCLCQCILLSRCAVLQARVALSEVLELLEAAEAKASYGLAINWKPLQALVDALLDRGVLQVREL